MKTNLKEKIFTKIRKEKIEPLSESYFINKYRIFWGILGISILLAILFIAFFFEDSSELFSVIGYTRGDIGIFMFPHIFWAILIIFLIFIGVKSLRSTSIGYRYPYWKTLIIGILIIIGGGFLFRWSGFGPNIHSFLVSNIPGLSTLLYNESAWNNPESGRLAGTILEKTGMNIRLQSIDGSIWNIDMRNSFISPKVLWNEKVRILGEKSGSGSFIAGRIIPWFGKGMRNGGGYGKGR